MKAAVYTRYGPPDVVQIKDVEKPSPREVISQIKSELGLYSIDEDDPYAPSAILTIPITTPPNHTFVSRRDYRHGAMLLVEPTGWATSYKQV